MKALKSNILKLSTASFALLLAAGCATVTDANFDMDAHQLSQSSQSTTITIDRDDIWNGAGDTMDPIVDRPRSQGE